MASFESGIGGDRDTSHFFQERHLAPQPTEGTLLISRFSERGAGGRGGGEGRKKTQGRGGIGGGEAGISPEQGSQPEQTAGSEVPRPGQNAEEICSWGWSQ